MSIPYTLGSIFLETRNHHEAGQLMRCYSMSVQYLIPATVIQYIDQHKLYTDNDEAKSKGKEKQ